MKSRSSMAYLGLIVMGIGGANARPAPPPPPAGSAQQAGPAVPTSLAPGAQPADVRMVLYRIYDDAFKLGDAVSALHPEQWKFGGRKRAAFYQSGTALRAEVTAFRTPWNGFYNSTADAAQGRAVVTALQALEAKVKDFMSALADTPGASQADPYQHDSDEMTSLGAELDAYVSALEGKPAAAAAANPPAATAANPTAPTSAPPATAQPAAEAPAAAPAPLSADDARKLLRSVYEAAFRVGDLTSALPVSGWQLSDSDKTAFEQKSASLRAAVASLESAWKGFNDQPEAAELGRGTLAALKALRAETGAFTDALASSPGAASAGDFRQAEQELGGLQSQVEAYVAQLEAREQPASPSGGVALTTEEIHPAQAAPPLTSTVSDTSPLNEQQLKNLLYQAYVPAFRLKDMLSQENPGAWKAPHGDQASYRDASQALTQDLADLTKWRDDLDQHPYSLEAAFEVYAALGKIPMPADSVGRLVGQYEAPKLGAEYAERAQQVSDLRDQLEPYLGYLLRFHDEQVGTVQRNFTACEQELGLVRRGSTQAAVPMKNIIPEFKGRRHDRAPSHAGKARSKAEHQDAKKSSKPARPAPAH